MSLLMCQKPEEIHMNLHVPVMLKEILEHLSLKGKKVIVDGTLGLGGHSKEILLSSDQSTLLVAIDRDARSLSMAQENLKEFADRSRFVHDNFRNIESVLSTLGIEKVDGIVLDLGISSFQLDDQSRGFSFMKDGPLDMRMDQSAKFPAAYYVNSFSETELSDIIKDFGEDRWHRRIARSIVTHRLKKPIETTLELATVVLKAMPPGRDWERIHPATRTFQAFRIMVNKELESLESALERCLSVLSVGGRLCVISFHSLEDRIVKRQFRRFSDVGQAKLITKKPLRPTEEETRVNPRSRSACLRVLERI